MKTKIEHKKGNKRSLSETFVSIKSNQQQGNINKSNKSLKNLKKAKFTHFEQNGNPMLEEKMPISKIVDKQRKEQSKIIKQQNSIAKLSEMKRDTKEMSKLIVVKSEIISKTSSRSKKRRPYNHVNLTAEQITKKIKEIKSREVLSKRAKKILGILNRKLRENESKKLDTVGKKSNIKVEHCANTFMKNKQRANDDKTIAKNKHVQNKGIPQEKDMDSDIEEESDESEAENRLLYKKVEIESEEDELSEEEEEIEDEENEEDEEIEDEEEEVEDEEEEVEDEEEEVEDEEDIDEENKEDTEEENEDIEDEEDEGDEEKDQKDEEDEEQIIKKAKILEIKKNEVQKKNKQALQFLDDQKKGEVKKKRYVLFVGNLPLNITENEIKQHFLTKVGIITSIRIPTKLDKTPRGFAYVEVTNNIDFEKGLSLNHTFLKKKRINVQYSIPMGGKKTDVSKKFVLAKNMKLQALQKTGKLADRNERKKKSFKMEK